MKELDPNDDERMKGNDGELPGATRHPLTQRDLATLDTPPAEWGVEYRFSGESSTRTHLHIPEPPSHEAAKAHAEQLIADGGYDMVAVVRLPYDTK